MASENFDSQHFAAVQLKDGIAKFQLWAPHRRRVDLELRQASGLRSVAMELGSDGVHRCLIDGIEAGDRYQYLLDWNLRRPDPRSNFQPEGVHGPSQVVDHAQFEWSDRNWSGVTKEELVIYELHVGAFSESGRYAGIVEQLPKLKELGITAIELLPLAQCPGAWNWGYDGVNIFAPSNNYGSPDELKALVNACHELGIAVLLDVVYNHLGPEGNYLRDFGPYFSDKHHTPWGEAFNFDGSHNQNVRQFILDNVRYWIEEFHLDGLRLDAVHFMFDDSDSHILQEIAQQFATFQTQQNRQLHLIAEANVFDASLLAKEKEQDGIYDGIWCDCLMHSIYAQARPELQLAHRKYVGGKEVFEVLQHGYLYRVGNPHPIRVKDEERHNEQSASQLRCSFVTSLQTHDSVGNHPQGKRIHELASVEYQRSAAALVLLQPSIPQIFMGEESAHTSPFPFFVNFEDQGLQIAVERGRAREYPQHEWGNYLSPIEASTFHQANLAAGKADGDTWSWYQKLLEIRSRGITERWLAPENLQVAHNEADQVFTLQYQTSRKLIRILCRLVFPTPSRSIASQIHLDASCVLLADSLQPGREAISSNTIELFPSHAVILETVV